MKIKQAILDLAKDSRLPGSKKLQGLQGWRIRKGDYRVTHEIQDAQLIIIVLDVVNKRDVYR